MARIVNLLVLCLLVGLVLAFLGVTPHSIVTDTWHAVRSIWDLVLRFAGVGMDVLTWAMQYILLGAVIVVPVALVSFLLRMAKRRGS
jgi:Family of unknown function (DUF6460)